MSTPAPFPRLDRRRHPRERRRVPVILAGVDINRSYACVTEDISLGGVRLRSAAYTGIRRCRLVIGADDDQVEISAVVLDEVVDLTSGCSILRLAFDEPGAALDDARSGEDAWPDARRKRTRAIAAGVTVTLLALLIAVVIATASQPRTVRLRSASDDRPETPVASTPVATSSPTTSVTEPRTAPTSAPTTVPEVRGAAPDAPATTTPPPVDAPTVTTVTAPLVVPAPAVEAIDHAVQLIVGDDGDVAAVSTVGPSADVDRIRVELLVTPVPENGSTPVLVRIENRDTVAVSTPGGLVVNVTASRDGAVAASTTLSSTSLSSIDAGETVELSGFLDQLPPGRYDLDARFEVTR